MADAPKLEATDEFCFLYSTYPNMDAATAAARSVINKKLAACVNLYPPMKSFYMWEGALEEATEIAAFFKTRRTLANEAIAELWATHAYAVPCFIVLPIESGTPDYLAWARAQTERPVTV